MTPIDLIIALVLFPLFVNAMTYCLTGKLAHDFIPAVQARKQRLALERKAEADTRQWQSQAFAALKAEDIAFLSAGAHWTPPSEIQARLDADREREHQNRMAKLRAEQYQRTIERQQRAIENRTAVTTRKPFSQPTQTYKHGEPYGGGYRTTSADYWADETKRMKHERAVMQAEQASSIENLRRLYAEFGITTEEIMIADRMQPVAVVPTKPAPKIDSVHRTVSQYGYEVQVTHYTDGTVIRENVGPGGKLSHPRVDRQPTRSYYVD